MKDDIIRFIKSKEYKYLKEVGQGGTGRTILIKDGTINEQFVCKKYSPYFLEYKAKYYEHFVNEIKILYKINHPNIVRVFSYHLYPEHTTGYILMDILKVAILTSMFGILDDKIFIPNCMTLKNNCVIL